MKKTYCFAYYADGKFIGWYADSFGSIRPYPKLYSDLDNIRPIIIKNLTYKLSKLNETADLNLNNPVGSKLLNDSLNKDKTELSQYEHVELRVIECPIYDGPNPDFDKEGYEKLVESRKQLMKDEGILDIPGPSKKRSEAVEEFNKRYPRPIADNWIYADYNLVKEWAANEPTKFVEIIKPEY